MASATGNKSQAAHIGNAGCADCNTNGIPDLCELIGGNITDCNTNGIPDECDIASGISSDCNTNGVPDVCDGNPGGEPDCNTNGVPDECDIASGISFDCNTNTIPDDCETDCNTNGIADECDLASGTSLNCNANDIPDECEPDCNSSGVPDDCELCQPVNFVKLEASDGQDLDQFGFDIDISGETLIVGALLGGSASIESGAAYVFRAQIDAPGDWIEEAKLVPSDGADDDLFGFSVSVDGRWALVGALRHDDMGENSGAAYIFRRSTDPPTWTQVAKLTAPDGAQGDSFGVSVGISNNTALIGSYLSAPSRRTHDTNPGSAYFYRYNGTDWVFQEKVWGLDTSGFDQFGRSVAIEGNLAVIGAHRDEDSSSVPDSGSAYIFRFGGHNWVQETKLTPSDPREDLRFGFSAAISGTTVLIGADDVAETGSGTGDAYIFRFNGNDWIEEAKLLSCGGTLNDRFGRSVAIDGNTALVGAFNDGNIASGGGSVHMFQFDGQNWVQELQLIAPNPTVDARFGIAVAMNGGMVAIGASLDIGATGQAGAAYIAKGMADCNGNSRIDFCDIATAGFSDCNSNGVPDECVPDCNSNGIPDDCDISQGTVPDCNANGIPDICPSETDCNTNGIPDDCEVSQGTGMDCNLNGILDSCTSEVDCNTNGIPDACDIAAGTSLDCNSNGTPDDCDLLAGASLDCNTNGVPDQCDIDDGTSLDCQSNGVPDVCDLASGTAADCNTNGIPDACETDCNFNGVPDDCDILGGASLDCNTNLIPDDCEPDCNVNGVTDECDISSGSSPDVNTNGIPDECDTVLGFRSCADHNGTRFCLDLLRGQNVEPRMDGVTDLELDLFGGFTCQPTVADVQVVCRSKSGNLTDASHHVASVTTNGSAINILFDPALGMESTFLRTCRVTITDCGVSVCVSALAGDADRNGRVTTGDFSQTRFYFNRTVDAFLAPFDVNQSGTITTGDTSIIRFWFNLAAPDCP